MQTFGETADINETSQELEILSSVIVNVNINVNIFVLKANMSQYWWCWFDRFCILCILQYQQFSVMLENSQYFLCVKCRKSELHSLKLFFLSHNVSRKEKCFLEVQHSWDIHLSIDTSRKSWNIWNCFSSPFWHWKL